MFTNVILGARPVGTLSFILELAEGVFRVWLSGFGVRVGDALSTCSGVCRPDVLNWKIAVLYGSLDAFFLFEG